MSDSTAVVADYFRLLRRQTASATDGLHELVDRAIGAINGNSASEAVRALEGLKQCLNVLRPLVDGVAEREYKATMDYMVLRKQNLELQLLIAKLQGQDPAATEIQSWIREMDVYFSAAIGDLRPDNPK